MMNELDALENKVAQVIAFCRDLRIENTELRQRLSSVEKERTEMIGRMETARERIEQLALRLPEDKDLD